MKIVGISDLHGNLPNPNDLTCDILCICGDIVPLEIQRYRKESEKWLSDEFFKWASDIDCKNIVLIAGNHDFVFTYLNAGDDPAQAAREAYGWNEKIVYLFDSGCTIDNISFYGTPWIPVLWNWAFFAAPKVLTEKFSKIPDAVDILLTHSPGKNIKNTGVSLDFKNHPEYGSDELTSAIKDKRIKYWLCGHIHSGNHNMELYNNINVVNVSLLNEKYKVTYPPFSFEI